MILITLFLTFFKIGAFTFGGGYAMLPLIQSEVAAHGWMTAEELINFVAVSESTPGPFAINISTFVGTQMGGLPGAFCATLGVVMPSFIIILIVAKCYEKFKESKIVKGCMSGLRPATVGLIGSAVISAGLAVFFPNGWAPQEMLTLPFITSVILAVVMLILALKKMHPILIIAISAAVGIIVGYLPALF